MKRKLLTLTLLAALSLSLIACGNQAGTNTEGNANQQESNENQQVENNDDTETSKPVKKYEKVITYASDGKTVTTELEHKYDEKGRETYTKQISFSNNSTIEDTITEYEGTWVEEGNTAKIEYNAYELKGEIQYDDQGRMIKYVRGNANSVTEEEYTYDENGCKTVTSKKYFMGKLNIESETVYDKYDHPVEVKSTYSTGDTYIIRYDYEYDNKGNILSLSVTQDGVDVESKMDYIYDENGNLSRIEVNGVLNTEYVYDENGNAVGMKIYSNGTVYQENIVEYY